MQRPEVSRGRAQNVSRRRDDAGVCRFQWRPERAVWDAACRVGRYDESPDRLALFGGLVSSYCRDDRRLWTGTVSHGIAGFAVRRRRRCSWGAPAYRFGGGSPRKAETQTVEPKQQPSPPAASAPPSAPVINAPNDQGIVTQGSRAITTSTQDRSLRHLLKHNGRVAILQCRGRRLSLLAPLRRLRPEIWC